VAYRAAVRGKVEGMAASEAELSLAEREHALRSARARWLLALTELEDAGRRPGLVLVGGLPGTGKSTLAAALSEHAGFDVVSSDRVRKELAGVDSESRADADFGEGLYTPEWDDRTYEACLGRAEALVFEGKRVVVDASFRDAGRRRVFLDAALAWGVRARVLVCTAEPDRVRRRLDQRTAGPSDADWAVYEAAAAVWQDETDPVYAARQLEVPSGGSARAALATSLGHLRRAGLASGIA
jgi:predicted kinase